MGLAKDEVQAILENAQQAVDGANIKDEKLKQIAFQEAIKLLSGNVVPSSVVQKSSHANEKRPEDISSDGDTYSLIANRLSLEPSDVKRLFFEKDGEIKLSIQSRALPKNKATATKVIGLLLAAARQSAGKEDETPSSFIKEECKRYGRLDAKNFSKHILDLGGSVHIREESAQKRFLTVTEPGFEDAAAKAKELLQQ
jgi:hypothetical protein